MISWSESRLVLDSDTFLSKSLNKFPPRSYGEKEDLPEEFVGLVDDEEMRGLQSQTLDIVVAE